MERRRWIYFCVSHTQSVALVGVTHRCLCSQLSSAGSRQDKSRDEQRPKRPRLSSLGVHTAERPLKIDLQMCKSLENEKWKCLILFRCEILGGESAAWYALDWRVRLKYSPIYYWVENIRDWMTIGNRQVSKKSESRHARVADDTASYHRNANLSIGRHEFSVATRNPIIFFSILNLKSRERGRERSLVHRCRTYRRCSFHQFNSLGRSKQIESKPISQPRS